MGVVEVGVEPGCGVCSGPVGAWERSVDNCGCDGDGIVEGPGVGALDPWEEEDEEDPSSLCGADGELVVNVVVVVVVDGACEAGGIQGVAVVVHGFTIHGPPAGVFDAGSDVGWSVYVSGGKGESDREGDDGGEDEGDALYSWGFGYKYGSA